jgi:hypothetical protein
VTVSLEDASLAAGLSRPILLFARTQFFSARRAGDTLCHSKRMHLTLTVAETAIPLWGWATAQERE